MAALISNDLLLDLIPEFSNLIFFKSSHPCAIQNLHQFSNSGTPLFSEPFFFFICPGQKLYSAKLHDTFVKNNDIFPPEFDLPLYISKMCLSLPVFSFSWPEFYFSYPEFYLNRPGFYLSQPEFYFSCPELYLCWPHIISYRVEALWATCPWPFVDSLAIFFYVSGSQVTQD